MKFNVYLIGFALLLLFPLAGRTVKGFPPSFLEVPPITPYIDHPPFTMPVFLLFAVTAIMVVLFFLWPYRFGFKKSGAMPDQMTSTNFACAVNMPWWGWAGLLLASIAWICAWGRFQWLGPLQKHTFTPLWLGYILTMDGLVYRRRGASLLTQTPRVFMMLFPVSTCVWWYFEYLNRFVQNWSYEGIATFSPGYYIFFASLCFSTVLPALFETADWLGTYSWFQHKYKNGRRWRPLSRSMLFCLLGFGSTGLFCMAIYPNPLFFLTWLSPLAIAAGTLGLAGGKTLFDPLRQGDYSRLFTLSIAALFCGFFWEMWNMYACPKWHYSVPYVTGYKLFEMPIVGYMGYLPFGPVCWCLWEMTRKMFAK